jgi:hypothetical protein
MTNFVGFYFLNDFLHHELSFLTCHIEELSRVVNFWVLYLAEFNFGQLSICPVPCLLYEIFSTMNALPKYEYCTKRNLAIAHVQSEIQLRYIHATCGNSQPSLPVHWRTKNIMVWTLIETETLYNAIVINLKEEIYIINRVRHYCFPISHTATCHICYNLQGQTLWLSDYHSCFIFD